MTIAGGDTELRSWPGGPIRTLVVDDEKLARSGLRDMLAIDPELVVDECSGGREAIRILRDGSVDVVFLDVQMPKIGGFDVIEAVGTDRMPVVVFVTAFSAYAIEAFEACALDYVVKPVREARLTQAVTRAKEAVRQRRLGTVGDQLVSLLARRPSLAGGSAELDVVETTVVTEPGPMRRVLLRSGTKSYYVDVDDIDWIESDNYYARIWTGVRSHLLRQSLSQLEASLNARQFVRVHRSAIVNVARVGDIRQTGIGRYAVMLRDGTQVPLSRDRKRALHEALRRRG
jgi:two-component system LytT family response regulator